MHGDGISRQRVWISYANKPRANLTGTYWCKVVPDTGAFRSLRREIQQGAAWSKLLANIRAEPRDTPPLSNEDQDILKHLVKHHALNPTQALDVRQVLDESCITAFRLEVLAQRSQRPWWHASRPCYGNKASWSPRTPILLTWERSTWAGRWGDLRKMPNPAHACW